MGQSTEHGPVQWFQWLPLVRVFFGTCTATLAATSTRLFLQQFQNVKRVSLIADPLNLFQELENFYIDVLKRILKPAVL